MHEDFHTHFEQGESALASGETLVALVHFEAAARLRDVPAAKSALGYCLAKERRQYQQGVSLCREAIAADPADPRHYYHLGRIFLLTRQKTQAIAAFRRGLKLKRHQPIMDELRRLGIRKPPVFSTLDRQHVLNRSFGVLLTRFGFR